MKVKEFTKKKKKNSFIKGFAISFFKKFSKL